MHLPVIRGQKGDILEPTTMMLHNHESSMIFIDKNDSNNSYQSWQQKLRKNKRRAIRRPIFSFIFSLIINFLFLYKLIFI